VLILYFKRLAVDNKKVMRLQVIFDFPLFATALAFLCLVGSLWSENYYINQIQTNWNFRAHTELVNPTKAQYAIKIEIDKKQTNAPPKWLPGGYYLVRSFDELGVLREANAYRGDQLLVWRLEFDEKSRPVHFIGFQNGEKNREVFLKPDGRLDAKIDLKEGKRFEETFEYGEEQNLIKQTSLFQGEAKLIKSFVYEEGKLAMETRQNGKGEKIGFSTFTRKPVEKNLTEITEVKKVPDGQIEEIVTSQITSQGVPVFVGSSRGTREEIHYDPLKKNAEQILRRSLVEINDQKILYFYNPSFVSTPNEFWSPQFELHPEATFKSVESLSGFKHLLILRQNAGNTTAEISTEKKAQNLVVEKRLLGDSYTKLVYDQSGKLLENAAFEKNHKLISRQTFEYEASAKPTDPKNKVVNFSSRLIRENKYDAEDQLIRTVEYLYDQKNQKIEKMVAKANTLIFPPQVLSLTTPDNSLLISGGSWFEGLMKKAEYTTSENKPWFEALSGDSILPLISSIKASGLQRFKVYDGKKTLVSFSRLLFKTNDMGSSFNIYYYDAQKNTYQLTEQRAVDWQKFLAIPKQEVTTLKSDQLSRFEQLGSLSETNWNQAEGENYLRLTYEFWLDDKRGGLLSAQRIFQNKEKITSKTSYANRSLMLTHPPTDMESLLENYQKTLNSTSMKENESEESQE
jgi:antitoxin component YwqK of YwqJK toxin-antitoxin module